MKLYVYEINTRQHLATITADTEDDCETQAIALFGTDVEYGWTFFPNFGKKEGLKHNPDTAKLNYGIGD